MITIIDYGAGNLFSVQNALNYLGVENRISSRAEDIISADKLILPGVGAFPDAMKMLDEAGLTDVIKEQAKQKQNQTSCFHGYPSTFRYVLICTCRFLLSTV